MNYYRDMTFCPFYGDCAKANECHACRRCRAHFYGLDEVETAVKEYLR